MLDLQRVVAKLGVEVFPVRRRRHGGAEDGFDQEAVVLFKRRAVGVAEGAGELFAGEGDVLAEGFRREVEAAVLLVRCIPMG